MTSCVVFASNVAASSESQNTIAYSAENCGLDHADALIMDMTEKQIVIQDLSFGKFILVERGREKTPSVLPFPDDLLSLHFSESGPILALTHKGVVKFSNLAEVLNWMQTKPAISKAILLQNTSLDLARSVYRLFTDLAGNMALWNKSESLLQVFDKSGNFIDAFPCQSNPVLTNRNSFISAFFAPGLGTRLTEIDFARPVENGKQKETNSLFIELQSPQEFQILTYNSSDNTFKGILMPPQPENMALNESAQDGGIDDQQSNVNLSQDSIESKETSADDEAAKVMFYSDIDKTGAIKQLLSLPEGYSAGKIKEIEDTVYYLIPQYEFSPNAVTLKKLELLQQRISK